MSLYYIEFLINFSLKSHLLVFFLTKNSKIKTMNITSKRYIFFKLLLYYKWFWLKFSLKSHLLFFSSTKKGQNKDDVPPIKNVTLIVAVLYRFFAKCLSKFSPSVLFWTKNSKEKDNVPRIKKNVIFFENFCCIIRGFAQILSKISPSCYFFWQKTAK